MLAAMCKGVKPAGPAMSGLKKLPHCNLNCIILWKFSNPKSLSLVRDEGT
jgi:hypothetical protein